VEKPPEKVQLMVSNEGKVPLTASLKSSAPFDVIPQSLKLEAGATHHVTATMNHEYRKDLRSHKPRCTDQTQDNVGITFRVAASGRSFD
jgi:hypothetical protein